MLSFYVLILYYLFKLEQIGCKCALNWRRNFIIGFLFVAIFAMVISKLPENLMMFFLATFSVLVIANVIIMLQYVHYLKKEKCKCSESQLRNIITIVAIIHIFVGILGIIFIFHGANYLMNKPARSK